ncbi:MAG: CAP domain-containing protein [Solirubrobacteraceae bacterium]|nr:CAP domain-containing protein [Solirubrobacteraceae bacterium]
MALTAGLLTASPAAAASSCANADAAPGTISAKAMSKATLCLLNEERADAGLKPLKSHKKLAKAARGFSKIMVKQQFFDHVSPSGSTLSSRVQKVKYTKGAHRWSLGENIAWGTGDQATPASIVDAWMHSPGHKRNILDSSFTEIGIGIAAGAPLATAAAKSSGLTYTTDFGFRQ